MREVALNAAVRVPRRSHERLFVEDHLADGQGTCCDHHAPLDLVMPQRPRGTRGLRILCPLGTARGRALSASRGRCAALAGPFHPAL